MSKPNKTNKGNYVQAGRLTPDEFAREQQKQRVVAGAAAETKTKAKAQQHDDPRAGAGKSENSAEE